MITIISRGTKTHTTADHTIDCRHLPNPHTVPALRPRDGRQALVQDWVLQHPETQALIDATLPHITDGMTIATMCNAGRHRSVAVAEEIARRLTDDGHQLHVHHLNLKPTKPKASTRARAKTHSRGYGHRHQKLRASWDRRVQAGGILCARCNQPITPGEPWDLGHDDHDRTRYQGPEHRGCNRSAGARNSNHQRTTPHPPQAAQRPASPRQWWA